MGTTGIRQVLQTGSRRFKKKNGGFTGVKTFEVWLSDNRDSIVETVPEAEDPLTGLKIPQFREGWSLSKPGIKVVDTDVSEEDDGYLQKVTVNYTTDDIPEKEDNPVDDEVTYDYDTAVVQKVLYRDPIQEEGAPGFPANGAAIPKRPAADINPYLPNIWNAAKTPTPIMVDDGDRLCVMKRNIASGSFDPDTKFTYEFSCNELPVTIDGKTYAARRVVIKKIKVTRKKTRNDIGFHAETIIFSIDRPGYDQSIDLLNQGIMQLVAGQDNPIKIVLKGSGKDATKPVIIDKDGAYIKDADPAKISYFRFFKYPEVDWTDLGIT